MGRVTCPQETVRVPAQRYDYCDLHQNTIEQRSITKRTSGVDEEHVLYFVHVTGSIQFVANTTSLWKVNSTHTKSTGSPLSPFPFNASSSLWVLNFEGCVSRRSKELMRRCTPVRKIALAMLAFELLVRFEQPIVHPVIIFKFFICLSIEGAIWELQRFL